jgi:hypothetical protein
LLALLISAAFVLTTGFTVRHMFRSPLDAPAVSTPFVDAKQDAALRAPFADLASGRIQALAARFTEDISPTDAAGTLTQMQALVPPGQPVASRVLGQSAAVGTAGRQASAVHLYEYPHHVAQVETVLVQPPGASAWLIGGLNVRAASKAEIARNRLSSDTLTVAERLFIAATAAAGLLTWLTAVAVLLWKDLRFRWGWLPFVLIGIGQFSLNSGTSAINFQPVYFQLFAAGAFWSTSPFDAWMFFVAFPVGALLFWADRVRRRLRGLKAPRRPPLAEASS